MRVDDPVLLRFFLWAGIDIGLPVQVHTGFGDRDLPLRRADPALLQPWLDAVEPTGVPVVLLHGYPFHRNAAWLAQVYPHVYLDVGLTLTHAGARAAHVLGEILGLRRSPRCCSPRTPTGCPRLSCVGASQFRDAASRLLDGWISDDAVAAADAERIATAIGSGNALRVYRLDAAAG